MKLTIAIFLAVCATILPRTAAAHHSFAAEYDGAKPITIIATITRFDMINPHSWLYVDTKDADGKTVSWQFETAAPNILFRRGFKRDYFKVGTVDGKPDLQGVWIARNAGAFDVTQIAEEHEIPYLPEALEREQKGPRVDPIYNCSMPGIPRITYMPFPIQIAQRPGYILFLYEYMHDFRLLFFTPREHVEEIDFFLGDSIPKWDGDSLVIDVTNLKPETWLDSARHTHSEALHIVERFTRAADDTILYEAELDDSKVFTRPFKIKFGMKKAAADYTILESGCYEGERDLDHMKDTNIPSAH